MNRATVGFVYNQPCPLKCDFCCHTREVVGPGRACPENVTPAVLAFATQPSVTRFAFTGGDPFLYIDEIITIMRTAREAGVTQPLQIVTSGFWAKSPEATDTLLATLRALGLDLLSVSYDKQHARWVSPQQIHWIADACHHHNIALGIQGIFWTPGEKVEDLLPDLPGVPMSSELVVSIGRARDKAGEQPRYTRPDEAKYTCSNPRKYDLTIYPNGDVYPCCSGGFNKEAGLLCGNAFTDPPAEILSNVYGNFHARIAKEIGFNVLYSHVQRTDPDLFRRLPTFSSVDSVCQICRDLRTDPSLRQSLAPIYEQIEIDYALACVDEHAAALNLFSGH
jgi:Radical SAM superfamily/4Fe-4S single cluster domain